MAIAGLARLGTGEGEGEGEGNGDSQKSEFPEPKLHPRGGGVRPVQAHGLRPVLLRRGVRLGGNAVRGLPLPLAWRGEEHVYAGPGDRDDQARVAASEFDCVLRAESQLETRTFHAALYPSRMFAGNRAIFS